MHHRESVLKVKLILEVYEFFGIDDFTYMQDFKKVFLWLECESLDQANKKKRKSSGKYLSQIPILT